MFNASGYPGSPEPEVQARVRVMALLARRAISRAQGVRRGFTLIELLVVISLMLVLAGLIVMFWPGLNESQRAAQGAAALQGWLNISKQRALRDQAPRGIRLYVNSNLAVEAQYIEQPDDFTSGKVNIPINSNVATIVAGGTLSNGQADQSLWPVQGNDYLELVSSGLLYKINSVDSATQMTLAFAATAGAVTSSYNVIRAPRVFADEKLTLPTGIAVDFTTNAANGVSPNFNGTPATSGYLDILFAPSGYVIRDQANVDIIYLWVRDVGLYPTTPLDGEPTIIAVYGRTGLVAAYPPRPSGDPYQFVKAGGTTQ
jgi:prepilin-type N-terminal cleavage/methylation domain-containing protein